MRRLATAACATVAAMRRALLAVCLLVTAAGCGYHLVGTSDYLPEDLTELYVERFENRTSWSDIDQRLNEAITAEWVRRRRFNLVENRRDAQAVLEGTIQAVMITPVTFDDRGRATEYQMSISAHVKLVDVRGEEDELLWEDRAFSRRTSYEVDVRAVDYFDRQAEAMDELSQEFAPALVSAVLEGF
jgi:outer membrane lipopolysaccharide assembly protein LptE/RlpB